ncbi:hypothetical protein FXO37_23629 [Capsicum annuum]|nr:hypothetical protein FXO37_23629 [Capsicum annuum]
MSLLIYLPAASRMKNPFWLNNLPFFSNRKDNEDHFKNHKLGITVSLQFDVEIVRDKNWFYKLSFPGKLPIDHINVIFYYLSKKGKYDPPSNFNYTTIDLVFKIKKVKLWENYMDPQSCTSSPYKEYVIYEYINRYRLMAGVPWHTVDHVLIHVHMEEQLHWLTNGQGAPNQKLDIALLCIRYVALLCDYD